VQEVIERPEKGGAVSTTFKFDKLPSPSTPFRTSAKTASLPPEIYDLTEEGRAVRTELTDAAGRFVETVVWADDDVLKASISDNRGGETRYTYDARGNLIREASKKGPQAQAEVVVSEYNPRFNLLTRQVDAKGGVSTWVLDPRTGDLLESHDAKGVVEKYRYDNYGLLLEAETAAGKTTVLAHDTFGSALRVRLPSGKIETREYDPRGRRYTDEPDPPKK
jgi:YD repeat-containing protein